MGRGAARRCRRVRCQSRRGRLAGRLCVLGANPGRQPDAAHDSPADRRALGRARGARHRAGRSRDAAAHRARHSAVHRHSGALSVVAPSGCDQAGCAVVLSEHAVLYCPHRAGARRLDGAGDPAAAQCRAARPAACRAWPRLPRHRHQQRIDRLVFVARSAVHVILLRRQRRDLLAGRRTRLDGDLGAGAEPTIPPSAILAPCCSRPCSASPTSISWPCW